MAKDVNGDILTAKIVSGVFDSKCRKSINLAAEVKSAIRGLTGSGSKSTGIFPAAAAVGNVLIFFPFRSVFGVSSSEFVSVEYVGYSLSAFSNAYSGTLNFVNGNGFSGNRSIHSYFDKLCLNEGKIDNDMGSV